MPETNAERLATTKNSVQHARKFIDEDGLLSFKYGEKVLDDFDWVIEQAERVPKIEKKVEYYGDENCRIHNLLAETVIENKRLCESLKELNIQENAMQAHYSLAHKNMRMYKKYLDEIISAMNTERPAEEKTRDIREILNSVK